MIPISSVDCFIVYAFTFTTLAIGLRAGRGIKDIKEYALGNRSFGTVALVLTFLATNVAGESILDLSGEVNKTGIILSVVFIVGIGGLLVIQALFIAPNITYFNNSITMGDVMETLYGANSKIIAGVLGFFTAICVAGMEIIVLGLLCEWLLGIDYRWGVGLGGLLLAVYSAYGGIKSVTATDVFQFIVLLIVLPMITALTLKQAGGIKTVFTQVPAARLQIINHPNFSYYLVLFLCKIIFQFDMIDPALIQRFLMAKNRRQLRDKFLAISVFSSTLYLTIMLTGLAGAILYPNLSGAQVIPTIINDLLPTGIKGLAIAGLIAVTMATIDSFLHAAGLTFTHDVLKPIFDKRNLVINELRWTKYATILVSLFAIIIGLKRLDDLYGLLLVSYEFTCPILAFPLWGGIIGLKPDKSAFYIATITTVVVLLLARWLLPEALGYFSPLIGVSVNGAVFLGMHVVKNKGFAIVSRKRAHDQVHVRPWRKESLAKQIRRLMPTPQNIVSYSKHRVTKYGASYTLLGTFCIVNYIVPCFMWGYDDVQAYELMFYLRFLGAMLCAALIVKDKWPVAYLSYLPAFWHFTLLYCLPFTSTVMFLLTGGSVEWLINVAITIMFLIVLVDWVSFIILTFLGLVSGFLFYQLVVGPISLQIDFSKGYLLVYTCVFTTLIALLFARRREQHLAAKLREIADHYYKMGPTRTDTHPAAIRIANMIDHQVQEHIATYGLPLNDTSDAHEPDAFHTATTCLHYFFPTALAVIQQGAQMPAQIAMALKDHYITPQRSLLSVQACVTTILETYHRHHLLPIQVDFSNDYKICASFQHLQYALIHVLRFLHSHYNGETIRLWITQKEGIHLRLPGQVLPSTLMRELFSLFPPKEYTKHMGLALSRLLIEAHDGYLLCRMQALPRDTYTEFVLRIAPTSDTPQ